MMTPQRLNPLDNLSTQKTTFGSNDIVRGGRGDFMLNCTTLSTDLT